MEFRCRLQSTRYRSSSINLGFHFIGSFNWSVLHDSPDWVSWCYEARSIVTIFTSLYIWASCILWVFWYIRLASFLRNTCRDVSVMVQTYWVSTWAWSSHFTINKVLRRQKNIRPSAVTSNINSIREGTCSSHCPTTSTILWNMLIPCNGHIVDSWHIPPIPIRREVLFFYVLEWLRFYNSWEVLSRSLITRGTLFYLLIFNWLLS